MYQYIAVLKSNGTTIAEGHNLDDVEKELVRISHDKTSKDVRDSATIYHVKRNRLTGKFKRKLVKETPI